MIIIRREIFIMVLVFLFVTLISTSEAYAAKMYKWTDKEGNVTYSQIPPPADTNVKQESIKVSEKIIKPSKRGKRMYCGKSALPKISNRPERAISTLEESLLNWRDNINSNKERRNEYASKYSKRFGKLSYADQLKTYNEKIKETECKINWANAELQNLEGERTKIFKNHDNINNALRELKDKKISTCGSNQYSGLVVLDDKAREYFKCAKRFDREIRSLNKKLKTAERNVKMIDY